MSNQSINMEAESPQTSPTSTRIPSPEIQAISPRTAATALAVGQGDLSTVMGIAQSLVETVRRRERDHAEERERFQRERAVQGELLRHQNSRLEYMEARIRDHRPTEECPEGFTLNRDGLATSFVIPIQDNLFEPAHWVKQLADGRVAGYPRSYNPQDTPFIAEIYASPYEGDDDGITLPTPSWLLEMLKGSGALFARLANEVKRDGDWGLLAEIIRFRELEHHKVDIATRLDLLHAEQRGLRQAQDLCLSRLKQARLDQRTSALRTVTPGVNRRRFHPSRLRQHWREQAED